jgi:hypothetical protein
MTLLGQLWDEERALTRGLRRASMIAEAEHWRATYFLRSLARRLLAEAIGEPREGFLP